MNRQDSIKTVIDTLSDLIIQDVMSCEHERTHPSFDADRMDDKIKFHAERANELRALRNQIEDVMGRCAP